MKFVGYLLLLLALLGCRVNKMEEVAPAPELSSVIPQLPLPISSINIPMVIPYADLAALLNREIGEILYEDLDYENNGGDNLVLVVKRTGPIQLGAKGEFVQVRVPLHIYVKGRVRSTLGGLFSQQNAPQLQQDAHFDVLVTLSSKLEVLPDWSVRTQSQISFKWTNRPYLEIGVVKIPIGGLIEKVVEQQLALIGKTFDQEAKKQLQFKKQLQTYWDQLYEPIVLPGPVSATLLMRPDSVYLSPLTPDVDALRLTAGIRAGILLSTASDVRAFKKQPMPALRIHPSLRDEASVLLTAGIDYATASKLARENLVGQTFTFENGAHRMELVDFELYGRGNTMIAKVQLKGQARAGMFRRKKIDGIYYFRGTPYYDADRMEIRVKDFDFDIKSRDLLLKSAEWLFRSNFKKQVENQLRYPVKKELEELRKLVSTHLRQERLGGYIDLSGNISRLTPTEVQLNEKFMLLLVESSGNVALRIRP
jgi:hypothetical protein